MGGILTSYRQMVGGWTILLNRCTYIKGTVYKREDTNFFYLFYSGVFTMFPVYIYSRSDKEGYVYTTGWSGVGCYGGRNPLLILKIEESNKTKQKKKKKRRRQSSWKGRREKEFLCVHAMIRVSFKFFGSAPV